MLRILLFITSVFFGFTLHAEILHEKSTQGDYYAYIPEKTPQYILVVAHGMLSKSDNPHDTARKYLSRWISYAEKYGLLVVAPVFDTPRFGNLGGGYGGYRNLFGKYVAADKFVNDIVDHFSSVTSSKSNQFYLYGHSAGGQFVNRYVVTHPNRIINAVVSASGRYSYPNKSVNWPYGAGNLTKSIKWNDGTKTNESITKSLLNYAHAAAKVSIVIGASDLKRQPVRPAHKGITRIDLAKSWALEMNDNAKRHGISGKVNVLVVPSIGHDSAKLTPYCAKVLFAELDI